MKKRHNGFTFIEILIVFLILVVGLVAIAKLQVTLSRRGQYARQQASAVDLAKNKLEELRHFEVLNTTAGLFAYEDIVSGSDVVAQGNATYTRTWTVTNNTSPNYKTVDIVVAWIAHDGISRSIDLTTIIGELDPAFTSASLESGTVTP